jgi:hypothetical protein
LRNHYCFFPLTLHCVNFFVGICHAYCTYVRDSGGLVAPENLVKNQLVHFKICRGRLTFSSLLQGIYSNPFWIFFCSF